MSAMAIESSDAITTTAVATAISDLSVWPLLAALVAVIVVGRLAVFVVFRLGTRSMKVDGDPLFEIPSAGAWIGALEITLYLLVILLGIPEAIVAWLVFKVAAKWETWAHVAKLPDATGRFDSYANQIQFGNWLHSRFILGTLVNILTAACGAWFYLAIA